VSESPFLENDLKEIYYQDCAEKMQQDLQECINNGLNLATSPFFAEK
jgi:hypothetical protein